jgi:hypothetical protein
MMPGMFSLPGELPGRLVAKVVDRLDYVSFPFVCMTCRKLYNLPSQLQIDKVPSSSKILGPILVGIHFTKVYYRSAA